MEESPEKWLDTKNNNTDKNECLDRIETINTGEPLFNNVNIKFKGKVIFKEKCIRKGIQRIKDVMINDRLISIQEFSNIYGNFPDTLLVYNDVIFNSVSKINM